METSAIARRLAARFVAGDTLADALEAGRRINREGISLTLDHLGESVTSLAEAEASRDVYLRALDELSGHGINGNVSLKLTQFGIDISEPTVTQARAAFDAEGGALQSAVGDVRDLPFRDESFDAIYSMGTIEHFDETERAVEEMARVLRPGGRFLCLEFSTVDVPGLDRIYDSFSFNVIPRLGRAVTNTSPTQTIAGTHSA